MQKTYLFLVFIAILFSNCTKDQALDDLNAPRVDVVEDFKSVQDLETQLDAETHSKLEPCQSFPTLDVRNFGGSTGGYSYSQAIIRSLKSYASCVNRPISNDFCGGNTKPGGSVETSIRTCTGYVVGSCTNNDGVVTTGHIMPPSFNPESFVLQSIAGAECGRGCGAHPTNVSVRYEQGPNCGCGVFSETDDSSIPCDQLMNEFHSNYKIFVTTRYICCCVGPGPGPTGLDGF